MVDSLPSMHETRGSIFSTEKDLKSFLGSNITLFNIHSKL
jgi:hypothetical protein